MKNIAKSLFKWNRIAALTLGFLLFLSFQLAFAGTNYLFFSVNGDTSRSDMTQGDNVGWGSNCSVGALVTWDIWYDANANQEIDTLSDKHIVSFTIADGDTSTQGPPPDINPIPDGWFIMNPMLLGIAPGHYMFSVRDHSDNSFAQRALICNPLVSPPNVFRGRVTVTGHPAPDSAFLQYIWIEANVEDGGNQMWSGLTDEYGLYQINIGEAGNGHNFDIRPSDIPGFVSPGDLHAIASGVVDSINFAFSLPSDSLYGLVRDQNGNLINLPISVYCNPGFSGPSNKSSQVINGVYSIYFGQFEHGQWSAGVEQENLIPDYLYPGNFDFNNTTQGTIQHNFVCFRADTVIYARVTENGGYPAHQYMVNAQSMSLQCGTNAISNNGSNNIVTLHITSLDASSWNINIANWDENYPIPPGYILEGNQMSNRSPGDTVGLNFIYGKIVSDTITLDPGDPPVTWNSVSVNLSNDNSFYNSNLSNNGLFTIYADTGIYNMNVYSPGYLCRPPARAVHITSDTTGGLGFEINSAHCHVSGALVNVPLPLQYPVSVNAHIGYDNLGYATWLPVDSYTGTFSGNLCDGEWILDPPMIPNRNAPAQLHLTISEFPDTMETANLVYFDPSGTIEPAVLPSEYSLKQNYPNPFNARTTIEYGIPKASYVAIDIFDLLGRKITNLQNGFQPAGYHTVIWDATNQPSGIYFYRIKAGNFDQMRKMLLLK
jgi:hypothetical protein